MSAGVMTILQAGGEQSSFDQLRLVYTLSNIVLIMLAAVVISYLISIYMRRLLKETMLQSYHDLLGVKVIITKTTGPDVTGEFRSEDEQEGSCSSDEWIYPGMSARITNYVDGIYRVRPIYVDHRDLSSKQNLEEIETAAEKS